MKEKKKGGGATSYLTVESFDVHSLKVSMKKLRTSV